MDSNSSTSSRKSSGSGSRKRRVKQTMKKLAVANADVTDNVGQVDEDVYIVEKIVGKKYMDTGDSKKLHYYIKWKGWASAHNTWEPEENLEGCQDALEQFEKEQMEKKMKKELINGDLETTDDENEGGSDKENMDEFEHMQKTRRELIQFGIELKWPAHMIPLEVLGVATIDKHLCYIVKIKTQPPTAEISSKNCVIVRSNVFRRLYPHVVISYYESRLTWVNKAASVEEVAAKAELALQISQGIAKHPTEEGMDIGDDDETEDELDDNGNPIQQVTIKKDHDKYNLPEEFSAGESSEDNDDDEFDEVFVPVAPKVNQN